MSKIKLFNHRLNQSVKPQDMQHEEFRTQVDLVLRSVIRNMSTKDQVIVIGAGKCNDFSLPIFIEEFNQVILTDIDEESMHECSRKRPNLEFRQVEYTGFDKVDFFCDFKERIVTTQDYSKIDQIIEQKLEGLENYRFLIDQEGLSDMVYVSPIFTQLVYTQIMLECSELRAHGYPEHLLKYVENKMLDEMPKIIDRFNENLKFLLKDDGYLVVLSDIFELENGTEFFQRVKNGIKNKDVMDEIYEGYQRKYGYGLGDYGLYSLDEKLDEMKCRWMFWPFTERKSFAVKMKIYQKNHFKGGTL